MDKISKYSDKTFDPQSPDQSHPGREDSNEKDFVEEDNRLDLFLAEFLDPTRSPQFGQLTMEFQRQALKMKLLNGDESRIDPPVNRDSDRLSDQGKTIGPGTIIADRYQVESYMAKGGFGEVYKGYHKQLEINIAIKLIRKENISHKTIRERFFREAKIIANIHHPHVVRIYDVGEFDGRIYLVMDFIDGVNLDKFVRQKRDLSSAEYLKLMTQISDALAAIHKQDVVHRDIKPANIMINNSGEAILMDFGLAKDPSPEKQGDLELTKENSCMGTPLYMSPEQFKASKQVTKASDVYSLGVTFYHMVTGLNPFKGDSVHEVYENHKNLIPKSAHVVTKRLPPNISKIIDRMLCKNPSDRYTDGVALKEAIDQANLKKSPNFVGITVVIIAVALAGIAAFMYWQKASPLTSDVKAVDQIEDWHSPPRIYSVIPIGYKSDSHTYFSDIITNFLSQSDYEIVERGRIESIIEELKLSQTEWSSKDTALRIGKLIGAHIIITGNISAYRGKEQVNIRAFNVETSEILGALKIEVETPEGAIETLLRKINERLVYRSNISALDDDEVELKHGKLHGAEVDMKLRILSVDEGTAGVLQVVEVDRNKASAKIHLKKIDLKVGMRVEEVKQYDDAN